MATLGGLNLITKWQIQANFKQLWCSTIEKNRKDKSSFKKYNIKIKKTASLSILGMKIDKQKCFKEHFQRESDSYNQLYVLTQCLFVWHAKKWKCSRNMPSSH